MILLPLLLAGQTAPATESTDGTIAVTEVIIRTSNLTNAEIRSANAYAHCMAHPYFVLTAEFVARRAKCRAARVAQFAKPKLLTIFDQIDTIVGNDPGSEASLSVVKVQ